MSVCEHHYLFCNLCLNDLAKFWIALDHLHSRRMSSTDYTTLDLYSLLKVSPFYYSKVCGACGNFDGVSSNDVMSPQKQIIINPVCLLASYAISNGQCQAQQFKAACAAGAQNAAAAQGMLTIVSLNLLNRHNLIPIKKLRRCFLIQMHILL